MLHFLTDSVVAKEVKSILHLPFVDRIIHHKAHRPIIAVGLGITIMLGGSTVASMAKNIENYHLIVDATGYFLHGIGCVPVVRYIDPLWSIIMGATEE